jgi:hypothetical protein
VRLYIGVYSGNTEAVAFIENYKVPFNVYLVSEGQVTYPTIVSVCQGMTERRVLCTSVTVTCHCDGVLPLTEKGEVRHF